MLRWFPILALVSGSAPSICKHDLGNIRLGNSVIFTTKGWENHITDNNVIITTSTTTLFSFFSLQQQVTFVAYSPSEYDALTHVLRQTNSGASCGSAASSNAGTLPNLPLKIIGFVREVSKFLPSRKSVVWVRLSHPFHSQLFAKIYEIKWMENYSNYNYIYM